MVEFESKPFRNSHTFVHVEWKAPTSCMTQVNLKRAELLNFDPPTLAKSRASPLAGSVLKLAKLPREAPGVPEIFFALRDRARHSAQDLFNQKSGDSKHSV